MNLSALEVRKALHSTVQQDLELIEVKIKQLESEVVGAPLRAGGPADADRQRAAAADYSHRPAGRQFGLGRFTRTGFRGASGRLEAYVVM